MGRWIIFIVFALFLHADEFYQVIPIQKSEPVYQTVKVEVPYKECWDEKIKQPSVAKKILGRFVGTLTGLIVGNQIGEGSGREIARFTGGMIGGDIGEAVVDDGDYKLVRKCRTVYKVEKKLKLVGYNNYFTYNGRTFIKFSKTRLHEVRIKVEIP